MSNLCSFPRSLLVACFAFAAQMTPSIAQISNPVPSAPLVVAKPTYDITTGNTPKGIRLVNFQIADEKDQVLRMVWRDREIQHTPEKAALLSLAPTMLAVGGAGALDFGALEEELNDLGGYFAFSRGRSYAFADISAPRAQIEDVAKLFATALYTPRLSEITLTRRKRFLVNGMKASREKPENLANEILQRIVIGKHPIIAGITLEPPTTITSVSKADIEAWRKSVLVREGLIIVASGPMTREDVALLVDKTFADLPEKAEVKPAIPFEPEALARTIALERKVEQSIILLGGPVRWRSGGPDGFARNLAMSVLGGSSNSRLFVAVREKLGAAYGASASINSILGQNNLFTMQASVANDKASEALVAMQAEYLKFRETGVSDQEIAPLKRRLANGFPDAMRKANSAAGTIRTGLVNDLGYDAPNSAQGWINSQSVERINTLIKGRLPEKLTTILIVPSISDLEAKGVKVDCIIKGLEELPRCLKP
jgi:zinc protease